MKPVFITNLILDAVMLSLCFCASLCTDWWMSVWREWAFLGRLYLHAGLLNLAIDGMKFCSLRSDGTSFYPSMSRPVRQNSISQSTSVQPACWKIFTQSMPQAIASSADECMLTAGRSLHCQNIIAPQEGFIFIQSAGWTKDNESCMGCIR